MDYCRVAPDVKLGRNVVFHAFVNLYGCTIGDNSRIGTFVEIQKNAIIGKNVKVSSHTFICEGVTIEDEFSNTRSNTWRNSSIRGACMAWRSTNLTFIPSPPY